MNSEDNSPEIPSAVEKRERWGEGPWVDEPDRFEFRAYGLPCLGNRNPMGFWCGYVAVPPGHPLHGKAYQELAPEPTVHGGLTYSDRCQGHICHVPRPGEPDDVWWFGFDCGHGGNLTPGLNLILDEAHIPPWPEVYRNINYVKLQIRRLAKQLAGSEK